MDDTIEVQANREQLKEIRNRFFLSNRAERLDDSTVNITVHQEDSDTLTDLLDDMKIEWRLV